jgi:putative transposase
MLVLRFVLIAIRAALLSHADLALENLALRQQLAVLRRSVTRPKIKQRDRAFWIALYRSWSAWASALIIVKPETVVRWHRAGFRLFWRWRSRRATPGRRPIDREIIALIRRMASGNTGWGAPRIQAELRLLGHDVAESTVAKYMPRGERRPPSQSWRTFLRNHIGGTAACDFFVVPTAAFRLLFAFVVLSHDRRRIVHFNVTPNPTAEWAALQLLQAFPDGEAQPRYLVRDRDSVYGNSFTHQLEVMGIDQVLIAPRSPWQNAYAERVIGSIRRECLDHVIVLNEDHLRRMLAGYVRYYNESRVHSSLEGNAPIARIVDPPSNGRVVAIRAVGGLHHRYRRVA